MNIYVITHVTLGRLERTGHVCRMTSNKEILGNKNMRSSTRREAKGRGDRRAKHMRQKSARDRRMEETGIRPENLGKKN
jgi:hypothetical protein